MDFTDNIFVLFILLFFTLYACIQAYAKENLSLRNKFIAYSSLVFYGFWYPPAALLIIFHSFLAMGSGPRIHYKQQRILLFFAVSITLGLLGFFKYYNFFLTLLHLEQHKLSLILPLGISFFSFTMVGYYVDLYRKDIRPFEHFYEAILFIAFWPHLAAGPILRAKNIIANMKKPIALNSEVTALALTLISVGIIKKLLIADNLGAYVNWNVTMGIKDMTFLEAWATIIGFAVQIYADFSGYSDMAIGFALFLGFKLPANFNYPYTSSSLKEFWRRWHISLSTWFKDYVFIPLGGNRSGIFGPTFNILIVFILSGLWHGAGVHFLLWGLCHGVWLMGESILERKSESFQFQIHPYCKWLITMFIIMISWSFFRFETDEALIFIPKLIGFAKFKLDMVSKFYVLPISLLSLIVILEHYFKPYKVEEDGSLSLQPSTYVYSFIFAFIPLTILFSGQELPFIYFEF